MSDPKLPFTDLRRLILEEAPSSFTARKFLDRLHQEDHQRFIALCHELLRDDDSAVTWIGLSQLGQHGDRDDVTAEGLILNNFNVLDTTQGGLGNAALFALGGVGAQRAFPVLAKFAASGRPEAYIPAARQARTEQQRQQILEIARGVFRPHDSLGDQAENLRENALVVLQMLSSIPQEEHLLLGWVLREPYPDFFVIEALAQASEHAVPVLQRLVAEHPGTDVARAAESAMRGIRHPQTEQERMRHPMHPELKRYLRERRSHDRPME